MDPRFLNVSALWPEDCGDRWVEVIGEAVVSRDCILAFFDGRRQEAECVVDPADLRDLEVHIVKTVEASRKQENPSEVPFISVDWKNR